ncbi:hypothetical protein NE237_016802 [Protea cynaroides]|uniref:Uncharacterized protein n=1 Tax=Protea cynaroides TaxID=273540 RepID=A0A9Q0K741_9MAGN|nr:hypothetical protein NE237_016802 [Protea cynaroides]
MGVVTKCQENSGRIAVGQEDGTRVESRVDLGKFLEFPSEDPCSATVSDSAMNKLRPKLAAESGSAADTMTTMIMPILEAARKPVSIARGIQFDEQRQESCKFFDRRVLQSSSGVNANSDRGRCCFGPIAYMETNNVCGVTALTSMAELARVPQRQLLKNTGYFGVTKDVSKSAHRIGNLGGSQAPRDLACAHAATRFSGEQHGEGSRSRGLIGSTVHATEGSCGVRD